MRRWTCIAISLLSLALASTIPPRATRAASQSSTQAQLRSLHVKIERMTQQAGREAAQRDRLSAQLRAAELSLDQARSELERIDGQLNDYGTRRAATAAAQATQARSLAQQHAQLSADVRAAYLLGREQPLRLLLNQKSPLDSARLVSFYRYFTQARSARIAQIQSQVRQLGATDAQLAQQQSTLAALKDAQQLQLQQLARARDQRAQVLATLAASAHTHAQLLARLESQQAELERVLRALTRSTKLPPPADVASAFGRLRGQLAWPVSGQLTAQFGQQRVKGVSWNGVEIATTRDAPVHAVASGSVVYADWLPGLGLLVIVDHGEGYLSLYGHNDRLFKAVGAQVSGGEVIAAAGDTGGRAEPALYFEIRRAGKPVDPMPWFKSASPAPAP